jgi:membrane protein
MSDGPDAVARPWYHRLARWPLGFAGKVVAVLAAALEDFYARRCGQHAAGIAYRVLFSLAPLTIVLVSVFGLVLQNEQLRDDVVTEIVDALPVDEAGSQDIADAIEKIASPASALGFLSLLLFLFAATGMMSAIRFGLEAAMGVARSRPAARGKLVDLVLVVGAAVLVMVTVALNLVAQVAGNVLVRLAEAAGASGALVDRSIGLALPLVVSFLTVMLLYRFVPAGSFRFRDAVAGATVTAVLFLLIGLASSWIFASTTRWSVVYGSLTTLLVFLYSVYLYAFALLVGAAFAAEWGRERPPSADSLGTRLRGAVIGLFVHREPPPTDGRRTPS